MKRLLLGSVFVALPLTMAAPALADCNDLSPDDGDTVTCDSSVLDGPNGIETRALDDGSKGVTVNVTLGAEIDTTASGKDAIKLKGDDNTVINAGTIRGGDEAIVGGNRLLVDNDGSIRAADKGIVGENEAGDDASDVQVQNSGSIITVDKGIDVGGDGTGLVVTNDQGASIISTTDEAINAGDGARVENTGLIAAVEKAVDVGDNAVVENKAGSGGAFGVITSTANEGVEAGDNAQVTNHGTIQAFDDAVQVGEGAVIKNYGLIVNTQTPADVVPVTSVEAQDAVDIDSGSIENFAGATIRSTTNAAIDFDEGAADSTIMNAGAIEGTIAVNTDAKDTRGQAITNTASGKLLGTSGTALFLGQGEDMLTMAGGLLQGASDFGAGNDALNLEAAWLSGSMLSSFADIGLFDGGADFDTVTLGVAMADVTPVRFFNNVLTLSFFGGPAELKFTNWESFVFTDGSKTAAELTSLAPVPLPAGALLLGSGLLGVCLVRRRRG